MRSRSVEAGCGGKVLVPVVVLRGDGGPGADGAGGDDRCCARRGEAQHNALFQKIGWEICSNMLVPKNSLGNLLCLKLGGWCSTVRRLMPRCWTSF